MTACEATYSLTPGGVGLFVLDGRAGEGRPTLVVSSTPTGSVDAAGRAQGERSNTTLATVEGGGALSITVNLEAGSEASLVHHEQRTGAVVPLVAEILWP